MDYAIITPSYIEHFKYIEKYLCSFNKYVLDKDKIKIYFIIVSEEKEIFEKIINKYRKKCLIEVLYYDEILKKYNVGLTPDEILKKYGHYTYQTLKKYYSLMAVHERYSLMVDCESMWIRPTKMEDEFNKFFKQPYFLVSNLEKREEYIKKYVKKAPERWLYKQMKLCCDLLGCPIKKEHFLEDYDWFYDKKIFNDFIDRIEKPIDLLEKIDSTNPNFKNLFEIAFYRLFIFLNNDKYRYKIISVDELFENNLSQKNYEEYAKNLMEKWSGSTGLAEQVLILLNKHNIKELTNIFSALHFTCFRCHYTNKDLYKLQKEFIKKVKPAIFVTVQNHAFGINNAFSVLFKDAKYYEKYQKHLKKFKDKNFFEIFSIALYGLKNLINTLKAFI